MRYFQKIRFALLFMTCLMLTKSGWAQLNHGVVVETVAKHSEAEKAGLQPGDVLLSWTRDDAKGEIESPFNLSLIEIEQVPRGNVTLKGTRDTDERVWLLGPDDWGVKTRPNLPQNLLSTYLEGRELAKTGKPNEAVERWQAAAVQAEKYSSALSAWLFFHSAEQLTDAKQWKEADHAYEKAVQRASGARPAVVAQLFRAWGTASEHHNDLETATRYSQRAMAEDEKSSKESLLIAADLNNLGIFTGKHGDIANAEAYHLRALAIRKKLAPGSLAVSTSLENLGVLAIAHFDVAQAENYLQSCLAIREKLAPNSLGVGVAFNFLGVAAYFRTELAKSEDYFRQALTILEKVAPGRAVLASVLTNMTDVVMKRGDLVRAEGYVRRAEAIYEKISPGSGNLAACLANLGDIALERGDLANAEDYHRRALAIKEKLAPESANVASGLDGLGAITEQEGDLMKAEGYYRRGLAIREKLAPGSLVVAASFDNLGKISSDRNDFVKAEQYYREALAIQEKEAPNSLDVAESLNRLGDLARDRSDLVKAEEDYRQALLIREQLAPGSKGRAETLAALAGVMSRKQQPEDAAQLYEQALNALENQIAVLGGTEEVRSNFRAKHAGYYENYIDLLIAQNKPELAFRVLERWRARSLLEILAQSHVDIHKGVDPSLGERERSLQEAYVAKSDRRMRLLTNQHTEEQVAGINREIHELVSQYDDVEEQIRASSPTYAALTHPQPLDAEQVQKQLLDADTLLLEYSLGQERSYVFAVTPDSLTVHELPKQAEIESLARRVYGLLTAPSRNIAGETTLQKKMRITKMEVEYTKAVTKLGQVVLGPVAPQLRGKRLLIVSDGALQYIPFSILPEPGGRSPHPPPLIAGHEIVTLPSASVLSVLRHEEMGRKQAPKAVAVLADPVFSTRDGRVGGVMKPRLSQFHGLSETNISQDLTRSVRDIGFLNLRRLPFTRQEADAIMSVTPAEEGLKAVDFKASRELSTSPELASYRIVHLATHGLLDSEHPELSGLVLSLVDKQGKPQNGFLGLEDVYNLDLPVELVVLSACETGLGKEISGEGLIGLTRGFMYAGASRVVASLWSVDDVATAELMSRFYKAMLKEGLTPAEALRKAQMQMWRQKRWKHPYYWGAFEMQGEWKLENGKL